MDKIVIKFTCNRTSIEWTTFSIYIYIYIVCSLYEGEWTTYVDLNPLLTLICMYIYIYIYTVFIDL